MKTKTPKRKTSKTKKGSPAPRFQINERVLYYHNKLGENTPARVIGGPYPEDQGSYRYCVLLYGDKYNREVDEYELKKEPAPRFKRGDLVKITSGPGKTPTIVGNGTVVKVFCKPDIGYKCDVFWNGSGTVQTFDEAALEIDESEE